MSTPQMTIGSRFSASSTAGEVLGGVNLIDHLAVVTGGYSGIGLEATRALVAAGAQVIVPARDLRRATAALAGVPNTEVHAMDLMDASSIAAFVRAVLARDRPLEMLINAAGIMAVPLARDAEGHESHFSVNHLGHFRLTCGLWPALRSAAVARVVSVSSRAHQITGMDFQDLDFTVRPYDKWIAYGQSKTANALFAVALDLRGARSGIRAFSLHPGQIATTGLGKHLSGAELDSFNAFDATGRPRIDPERGLKTPAQGAATIVWCAASPDLEGHGGVYCEDCDIAGAYGGELGTKGVAEWATNRATAEELWRRSESLTGMSL